MDYANHRLVSAFFCRAWILAIDDAVPGRPRLIGPLAREHKNLKSLNFVDMSRLLAHYMKRLSSAATGNINSRIALPPSSEDQYCTQAIPAYSAL